MTESDRSRFGELMATLGEVFNESVTEGRLAGYWIALADMPVGALTRAVNAALRECPFFPKPAELRRFGSAVAVDAAWVNRMLSEAISGREVGPFVDMFIERLGGIHAVEDRLPNDRLPLVRAMYPGILAACRAREIPIPTEAGLVAPREVLLVDSSDFMSLEGRDNEET